MKFLISIIFFFVFAILNIEGRFQVYYQWRAMGYRNLPASAIYNSTHPVPFGMAIHKNRIYLGVPRRNSGVSSTLNYISMNDLDQEPALTPYPTFEMNRYVVSRRKVN